MATKLDQLTGINLPIAVVTTRQCVLQVLLDELPASDALFEQLYTYKLVDVIILALANPEVAKAMELIIEELRRQHKSTELDRDRTHDTGHSRTENEAADIPHTSGSKHDAR